MTRGRVLALCAMLTLLGACASRKPRIDTPPPAPAKIEKRAESAKAPSETSLPQERRYKRPRDGEPEPGGVDVATLVEPTPRAEPRARYGNKSPYSVLGKSYTVLPSAAGYRERGISSWYGSKFHGYMTSSLEPYDMYQFSAAHKSLPLPSYVRVTNLDNGKSVVVRVNDRGPFHENRIIDLSYAAAVRIGVWPKGTGLVEVQAISVSPAGAEPVAAPVVPESGSDPHIYLQLGAFAEISNAQRLEQEIRRHQLGATRIITTRINAREVHRVRLGPLGSVKEVDALVTRIEKLGLGTPRVAIDD